MTDPNDTWEQPDDATNHPFYVGTNRDEAICARHGEMFHARAILKKNGHIWCPRAGVWVYTCPECVAELINAGGGHGHRLTRPVLSRTMLGYMIETEWDELAKLFIDLGPGEMAKDDRGRAAVTFPPDTDIEGLGEKLPEYLREAEYWYTYK